jgi:hypothetical protein
MERVLPVVAEIAGRCAPQTIFTRFIPPMKPADSRDLVRGSRGRMRGASMLGTAIVDHRSLRGFLGTSLWPDAWRRRTAEPYQQLVNR